MKLGERGNIILIALLNMVAPLSTDMYMPALPTMTEYFHADEGTINLTLTLFFLFFAIGMLLIGPVSDKLGRKKILLAGLILYGLASVMCGLSTSIGQLIAMRICEAIGGGCMVAVSTAIVKDRFGGKRQATVLAVTQAMMVIAPMLAPVIGAQVLKLWSWRMTFMILAAIAVVAIIMTLLTDESLPKEKRNSGSLLNSFSHLLVVGKNRPFMQLLILSILFQLPMMAFISSSSYVFVNHFGLTPTAYSLFFGVNMALSVIGPVLSVKLRRADVRTIMIGMNLVTGVCGVAAFITGHMSPFAYIACIIPANIVTALARPYSTGFLMNMQKKDAGSASSLINFSNSIAGTIGMFMITGIWSDYITGIACLFAGVMVVGLAGTFAFIKSENYQRV